jgi:DNA polymerase/3'-5' exonuclease PolX
VSCCFVVKWKVTEKFLNKALPCLTEKQVFDHLKLDYVPPHLRILEQRDTAMYEAL